MKPILEDPPHALRHLAVILQAGERGYAVAAANLNNRALKMLFKTYAKQRSAMKSELEQKIGGASGPGWHNVTELAAMIHRGRINIFAALTIGEQNRERVVLNEILVGERAALHAYRRVLGEVLPEGVQQLVQRQSQDVEKVVKEIRLMRGTEGRQLVVRLYDTKADAARAVDALKRAQLGTSQIESVPVGRATETYERHGRATLLQTISSGAVGGAIWGSISGALECA